MSVKYISFMKTKDTAKIPFKKFDGDAGWDLYASRECIIHPGEVKDIHTDIHVNMPPRIFARIVGRSSTLRNHGLFVNEGVIDNGYTGELCPCIRNTTKEDFHVKVGMRLSQVIFHVIEDVRWSEVDTIEMSLFGRNNDGYGSTGVF